MSGDDKSKPSLPKPVPVEYRDPSPPYNGTPVLHVVNLPSRRERIATALLASMTPTVHGGEPYGEPPGVDLMGGARIDLAVQLADALIARLDGESE